VPPAAPTSAPATGPYDPNGYRPTALAASTQASGMTASTSAAADPYATPADRYASAAPYSTSASAATTGPSSAAAPVDRYAMPVSGTAAAPGVAASIDRYASVPVESAGTASPAMSATTSDPYAPLTAAGASSYPTTGGFTNQMAPVEPVATTAPAPAPSNSVNNVMAEPAPTMPAAAATVQLKSPPGQYRPGGTSSYSSGAADSRIDVAARPGSSAVSPSAGQPSPPQSSDPWAPPPAAPAATPSTRVGGGVNVGGGSSVY
jgi:hypothetical protein